LLNVFASASISSAPELTAISWISRRSGDTKLGAIVTSCRFKSRRALPSMNCLSGLGVIGMGLRKKTTEREFRLKLQKLTSFYNPLY